MIDHDEFLLPNPFDTSASEAVSSFLATRPPSTASVCLGRTHFRQPIDAASWTAVDPQPRPTSTPAPLLTFLGSQLGPDEKLTEFNLKCIHRVSGVHQIFVHWPEVFRPNQSATEVEWIEQDLPNVPKLAHLQEAYVHLPPYKRPYRVTHSLLSWIREVWGTRDALVDVAG